MDLNLYTFSHSHAHKTLPKIFMGAKFEACEMSILSHLRRSSDACTNRVAFEALEFSISFDSRRSLDRARKWGDL